MYLNHLVIILKLEKAELYYGLELVQFFTCTHARYVCTAQPNPFALQMQKSQKTNADDSIGERVQPGLLE